MSISKKLLGTLALVAGMCSWRIPPLPNRTI